MSAATLIALVTFCFVTSITPGPNNTLLLASGSAFGFRRSLPHMLGVDLGFGVMLLAIGIGFGEIFRAYPVLHQILAVLATIYMIWLAWRIGMTKRLREATASAKPLTFLQAAAFQWANPKGWAAALSVMTIYVSPATFFRDVFIVSALFPCVMLPCIALWTGFGVVLRRLLTSPGALRAFHVLMALLLLASIAPFWIK